jgi:tetratricopeptide (TPR) repeat protein
MLKKLTVALIILSASIFTLLPAEKYAVLITGSYAADVRAVVNSYADLTNNEPVQEFWNDTYLQWELLIKKGFKDKNIYVLFADGKDFYTTDAGNYVDIRFRPQNIIDDSELRITDKSATKSNIEAVTDSLKLKMTKDDFLYVWTFGHGDNFGGTSAYLYLLKECGNDSIINDCMSDSEFASYFNPLIADKKVYSMAQCRGGGFKDNLTNNYTSKNVFFDSACHWDESSYRADNRIEARILIPSVPFLERESFGATYNHSEFNFHKYSCLEGENPQYQPYYYLQFSLAGVTYPKVDFIQADGFEYDSSLGYNDGVITVEEARRWNEHFNSSYYEDALGNIFTETPDSCDAGNIGYHTSLEYPTIILNECSNPRSYLYADPDGINGIVGISQSLSLVPSRELKFINSNTTVLENRSVDVLNGSILSITNSIFTGTGFDNSLVKFDDTDFSLGNSIILKASTLNLTNMTLSSVGMPITRESNINVNGDVYFSDLFIYAALNTSISSEINGKLTTDTSTVISFNGGKIENIEMTNGGNLKLGNGFSFVNTSDTNISASAVEIGLNSTVTASLNSILTFKSGSSLKLLDGSELIIQDGSLLVFEPGSSLIIEGNAKITGNFTLPGNAKMELYTNSILTINNSILNLDGNAQIIGHDGAELVIGTSSSLVTTIQPDYNAVTPDNYINITGNWKGIRCESGSSVMLNRVKINGAEFFLRGSPNSLMQPGEFACVVEQCQATACLNVLDLSACANPQIKNNKFTGIDAGTGITLTQSNGTITGNTVDNFNRGISIISGSPIVLKNTLTNNRYNGFYTIGLNSFSQLGDLENTSVLNNNILNNGEILYSGDILPVSILPSQVCVVSFSNIYMENGRNNIYSTGNNIPCVGTISLIPEGESPRTELIYARNNYWGSSGVTNDFFAVGGAYFILYEPYCSHIFGSAPQSSPLILTDSKSHDMLVKALNNEIEGKYDKSIKDYKKIIDKYPESVEALVAYSKLPDNYSLLNLDNEPLIALYDMNIANENANKKFFRELKVASHIKSRKYDEAITLSEQMKLEADTEEEVILCEIDIAIANMLKESGSKGGRSSVENSTKINDLCAKLTGSDVKSDPSQASATAIPSEVKLYQNYPNPFNPVTQIRFDLAKISEVKLRVYNVSGQIVAELADGVMSAGSHSVECDGSRLNSGVYYYTLETNGHKITSKMVLTK